MTKWQTRQALYLLGLTGILYLFSCKSQVKLPQLQRCKKNLITFESTFAMIFLLYSNQYSLIDSSFFLKKFSFSFMI